MPASPFQPLALAVAQPSCVAHDVVANARAHAALVRAAGARVVVFPEMSLTGYELDAAPVAPPDPRLAPLVEACAEVGAVVLAGAPVPIAGTTAGFAVTVMPPAAAPREARAPAPWRRAAPPRRASPPPRRQSATVAGHAPPPPHEAW